MKKLAAHVPGWWYIDKFGFDVGAGNATLLFEVAEDEVPVFTGDAEIVLYLDEDWPKVRAAVTCEDKRKLSKDSIPMASFTQSTNAVNWGRSTVYRRRGVTSTTKRLTLAFSRPVTQFVRPHYWYFCWVSCGSQSHPVEDARDKIYFKFIFQQENGSHTPIDNKGMVQFFALMLALYICAAMVYYRQYVAYRKRHKYDKIPDTVFVVPMALGFHIISVLFELLHLLLYARNGQGIVVLDAFSEICTVASQVIIIRLLLTYSRQTVILDDVAGWIVTAVLAVLSTVLAVWSSTYDDADAHDVYHDHHTLPRLLMYLLHLCCAGWFWLGMSAQAHGARPDFARLLWAAGVMWHVTPPICILLGYAVADYWQNSFITALVCMTQSIALGCISYLSLTEAPLRLQRAPKSH
jgi:hypothetical protein